MAAAGDSVRVVLVDDHELFRNGLRDLLTDEGVDVVGDSPDGPGGVELAVEHAPDVVVMDLHMPGMSGVEATTELTRRAPASRVLMLTVSSNEGDVMDAMLAGASGYILKDASPGEIAAAIRAAAAGESSIDSKIASRMLARLREAQSTPAPPARPAPTAPAAAAAAPAPSPSPAAPRADLTERELEVLRLIADGKPNAEIAGELLITPRAVANHIASILAKLQMETRIQAAVYALRRGIV